MSGPIRLGVVGAGRVFERLYLPALRATPNFELAAIADPVAARCATAGPGVARFTSLEELLAAASVDALAVLSPPDTHARAALLAIGRGLPVLAEKPLCSSSEEADRLRAHDAERLLTPALSRRYWPAYRKFAESGPVRELRIAIAVNPGGWDAHGGAADIAEDLFPHVADLARWLTSSENASMSARRGARGVEAHLHMANGARVSARLEHRESYLEAVRADGRSRHVGPPPAVESMARRVLRREDPAVQAVERMLEDWTLAIGGKAPVRLPRFEDGAATVAAMEQLRSALAG